MTLTTDAIIIGAGVIGTNIALELNRKGMRTISVDSNPASGHGATGASCAIIRVHYSTLDGTAFAYEGYHYWRDWADYLGVKDERGLAEFREIGCLVMCTDHNGQMQGHTEHCDALSIPYQRWNAEQIMQKLPLYDLSSFWPPKRMDDVGFGQPTSGSIENAIFFPTAGKMVAALIEYCENGHDHDETALQFELPYIQYRINVGFYSRKREINRQSSFSVLG